MSRLQLTVAAGWILMFGAGYALGQWVDRSKDGGGKTYLHRLQEKYDLDPDQVKAIRGCLDEEEAEIDAIMARVEQQVRAEVQSARDRAQSRIQDVIGKEFDPDGGD